MQLFGHHFIIDFILNFYLQHQIVPTSQGAHMAETLLLYFDLFGNDRMGTIWAYCWVINEGFRPLTRRFLPRKNGLHSI